MAIEGLVAVGVEVVMAIEMGIVLKEEEEEEEEEEERMEERMEERRGAGWWHPAWTLWR